MLMGTPMPGEVEGNRTQCDAEHDADEHGKEVWLVEYVDGVAYHGLDLVDCLLLAHYYYLVAKLQAQVGVARSASPLRYTRLMLTP